MKIKSIKLNKACDEKWGNMTPCNDGKFCHLCSKEVIDFTDKTQKEIIEKIKSSKGEICGKLTKTQLNTPYIEFENKKSFSIPYAKVASTILLATSFMTAQSCNTQNVELKTENYTVQTALNSKEVEKEKKKRKPMNMKKSPVVFQGEVLSKETNLPIVNASVTLVTLGKLYTAYTTTEGKFSLEIPAEVIDDDNVVRITFNEVERKNKTDDKQVVMHVFYENENIILTKRELGMYYKYKAENDQMMLGGIGFHNVERADPVVIINGNEIEYKKFQKIRESKRDDLYDKNHFYFEGKVAVALYGEKAKSGLHYFIDKD